MIVKDTVLPPDHNYKHSPSAIFKHGSLAEAFARLYWGRCIPCACTLIRKKNSSMIIWPTVNLSFLNTVSQLHTRIHCLIVWGLQTEQAMYRCHSIWLPSNASIIPSGTCRSSSYSSSPPSSSPDVDSPSECAAILRHFLILAVISAVNIWARCFICSSTSANCCSKAAC